MQSSENMTESSNEVMESDEHVLNFLDSMDSYLILMDSLSSALRQGWLDLASARYSMGTSRVNTTLLSLKPHNAPTTLQIENAETNTEAPRFTLCKWASSDDCEKCSEEAKFEEDDLLQNKSNTSQVQHQVVQERRAEGCESPVSADNHAEKARSRSLSMFGTLVSPKLRATQLSFETALETLVEISNVRASLLCAYGQVQKDRNGDK
ncbi:hypothetical protein ACS0TY_023221 [Phlomoides rotata]